VTKLTSGINSFVEDTKDFDGVGIHPVEHEVMLDLYGSATAKEPISASSDLGILANLKKHALKR
jgi:hypothetical protein